MQEQGIRERQAPASRESGGQGKEEVEMQRSLSKRALQSSVERGGSGSARKYTCCAV